MEELLKFYRKVVGGNIISFNIVDYPWNKDPVTIREDYLGYDHHYTFCYDTVYGKGRKKDAGDKIDSIEELEESFNKGNVNNNNQKVLLSKFIDIIS